MNILRFETIESTNSYAKTLLKTKENAVVIAKRQTGGRGTKGRSFSSEEGGVYLTKLTFYENFPAKDAFLVMARAAVAVCETLESFSLFPKIKWANDIFVDDKKICGILVENIFSGNRLTASIVGVGLNINNSLPEELKPIATTASEAAGKPLDLIQVERTLLRCLEKEYSAKEYIERVGYLKRKITLITGDERVSAYAEGVTERGELVAKVKGEIKIIQAGEVSLRYDFNE